MNPTLSQLNDWETQNGRCWVEEIQSIAESGGSWKTAAERFNVNHRGLKDTCRSRGFRFPWVGRRPDRDPRMGQKPNLYIYRGEPRTLNELAALSSLKVTTIYCRIHRKQWSVERAVETPVIPKSAAGRLGGHKRRHE